MPTEGGYNEGYSYRNRKAFKRAKRRSGYSHAEIERMWGAVR